MNIINLNCNRELIIYCARLATRPWSKYSCIYQLLSSPCNDAAFKLALKTCHDLWIFLRRARLANNTNIYRLRLVTYWLRVREMTSRNYWLECRQRDFIGQFEI